MTRSTQAKPLARRRTVLGAALLATAAFGVGLLSACGSGQITQTDQQTAAVPGVNAQSADNKIALRDGGIAYADRYKPGSTVPLNIRLFNNAQQAVKLTGATSDNGTIVLVGGRQPAAAPSSPAAPAALPSGSKKPSGSPSEPAAAASSPAPTSAGSSVIAVSIPVSGVALLARDNGGEQYLAVDKLTGDPLPPGGALNNVTLTFTYADGSTTTIKLPKLPMVPPGTPLPKPSPVVHGEGGAE
ncbi:hypothetical protein ACQP2P_01315 [Dactylosporangium sp. CA-139114]|uniref:hypothetical protein n=1 Tax=Dactylosporangium sp. CA-139114 TaxID=3239931 RepID=UPI003D991A79